jgi:hypothetical protein
MSRYLVPMGVSAKLLSLAISAHQQARKEARQKPAAAPKPVSARQSRSSDGA